MTSSAAYPDGCWVKLPDDIIVPADKRWSDGHLRGVELTGLGTFAMNEAFDAACREIYAIAVVDLEALVQEARFELGLGDIFEQLYQREHPNVPPQPLSAEGLPGGEPPPIPSGKDILDTLGMSVIVRAGLLGYARDDPNPTELFRDPHQPLAMQRTLSRWTASQLFDSAVYRLCAALDRLATALWAASGLALRVRKSGETSYPSFINSDLREIARVHPHAAIEALREIARGDNDDGLLLRLGKDVRDHLTHRQRWPFAGHGPQRTGYAAGTVQADDAETHLAIGLALLNVVRVCVDHSRSFMATINTPDTDAKLCE